MPFQVTVNHIEIQVSDFHHIVVHCLYSRENWFIQFSFYLRSKLCLTLFLKKNKNMSCHDLLQNFNI